ncbi:MAG: flavodoxin [Chloroflexota bacterium]
MSTIGIFYGSNTGNTEDSANAIGEQLHALTGIEPDVVEIGPLSVQTFLNYDKLVFGIPTWYVGEVQEDWEAVLDDIREMDLEGKQIAIFGHGDQYGYPDTYQDAIGIVGFICVEQGADLVGFWPLDGYDYDESVAEFEGMFMGLSLDDNQEELTPERIETWSKQIAEEFALMGELVPA